MESTPARPNASLLGAFVLPYALYVGLASLPQLLGRAPAYALAGAAAALACLILRPRLRPLSGPLSPLVSTAAGIAVGILGCAAWIALALPLAPDATEAWAPGAFWIRALAATLVVPLFEEQLMRGFVLGLVVQWERLRRQGGPVGLGHLLDHASIDSLEPGACTRLAALVQAAVFAAGHAPHEWPAACVYGIGMAGLFALRRDLLSCVVAHATTNAALAAWIWHTGTWSLW